MDRDYDAAPNFEPIKCSICLEKIPKLSGVVLRECLHGFCRDCLKITINSSEQGFVQCPFQDDEYKCTKVLQVS